jgi:hypothetical protein
MNEVIGQVEDIYPKRGGAIFDRGEVADGLEGVREVKEELSRLREVLDLDGLGRRRAAPGGNGFCGKAVGEEIIDHASRFRASES